MMIFALFIAALLKIVIMDGVCDEKLLLMELK